jgi:predicted kinase
MTDSSLWLIIVTGRPAAGKTTLARWLGERLAFPVISKDNIKEILFDQLGWRNREWSRKLGRASVELMYSFAQVQLAAGRSLILDNAFYPNLASPKFQVLIKAYGPNVLQMICNANSDILYERFKQRAESGERHPGHVDMQSLEEYRETLQRNMPLQMDIGGHLLQIDTTDLVAFRYDVIFEQVKTIMGSVQ